MSTTKEQKHLPPLIAVCFIVNFLLGISGGLFSMFSEGMFFSWAIANLFFMAGCVMFSIKLGAEGHFISSAAFTILAIGEGIFYSVQSTALVTTTNYDEYMKGILAHLPGLILICWYSGFPVWLRVLGLAAFIPFGIASVMMYQGVYHFQNDWEIDGAGFGLINLTGVIWSYYAFRPRKQ